MPIMAADTSSGTKINPAPPGAHRALCVDVVDLGMVKTTYPGKPERVVHKVTIVWQVADVDPETGTRFTVGKRYTLSLHEKSSLRKDLESWRGRQFSQEELRGFDLEKLLGAPCQLNIVHNVKPAATYANVSAIMPFGKGMEKLTPDPAYIRVKDRAGNPGGSFQADDSDVPF
jgi:hypothetical protein